MSASSTEWYIVTPENDIEGILPNVGEGEFQIATISNDGKILYVAVVHDNGMPAQENAELIVSLVNKHHKHI